MVLLLHCDTLSIVTFISILFKFLFHVYYYYFEFIVLYVFKDILFSGHITMVILTFGGDFVLVIYVNGFVTKLNLEFSV